MSPSLIISGFRGIGTHKVFSADPTTIGPAYTSDPATATSAPLTQLPPVSLLTLPCIIISILPHRGRVVSKWYEEGYDLFDLKYVLWLEIIILKQFQQITTSCHLSWTQVTLISYN